MFELVFSDLEKNRKQVTFNIFTIYTSILFFTAFSNIVYEVCILYLVQTLKLVTYIID